MGLKMAYIEVHKCRICGNSNLEPILDLGEQMLTGVFPTSIESEAATIGPLSLVKCMGGDDKCGLVQLRHSYDLTEMYGVNYGYRSDLNQSMVDHLSSKVKRAINLTTLEKNDLIIDIGSNDGTTLKAYPQLEYQLVGIDPTALKFKDYYPENIQIIPDFFSAELIVNFFPGKKAKIITSFSMFYDLEDPIAFMRDIYNILDDDGIWIFEQSYLPEMLKTNSFDTVCHEHLEYYCLKQINYMAKIVGFHILDVEFNPINGGSFSVTVRKSRDDDTLLPLVKSTLEHENSIGLNTLQPYQDFAKRVSLVKQNLLTFIKKIKSEKKSILALGASTKGNVLLQYCGICSTDIPFIGEVNTEKFNCYTPGSWIPIIPEDDLLSMNPDYVLVLPWHFRNFFEDNIKFKNINLVFPLPQLSEV